MTESRHVLTRFDHMLEIVFIQFHFCQLIRCINMAVFAVLHLQIPKVVLFKFWNDTRKIDNIFQLYDDIHHNDRPVSYVIAFEKCELSNCQCRLVDVVNFTAQGRKTRSTWRPEIWNCSHTIPVSPWTFIGIC